MCVRNVDVHVSCRSQVDAQLAVTDRSVETALPSTTPCQVRKSSTDNSEFRHRTRILPMIDRQEALFYCKLLHNLYTSLILYTDEEDIDSFYFLSKLS
jgi:hypothetical protein